MVYHQNFVAVLVCNDDIVREFDGDTVKLPFGIEYKLRFKNKEARKAVVSVNIDGDDVTKFGRIIVEGNSSAELEGFMDANGHVTNKFKFIQKISEIVKHRGDRIDDGIVTIQFQFEEPLPTHSRHYHDHYYGRDYGPHNPYRPGRPEYYSSGVLRGLSFGDSPNNMVELSSMAVPLPDEGITVRGSRGSQVFTEGTHRPLEANIHTITLRLKGVVEQEGKSKRVRAPILVRTKLQCSSCGRMSKSAAEFCSNCGTALK